jgi:hypothetical protein
MSNSIALKDRLSQVMAECTLLKLLTEEETVAILMAVYTIVENANRKDSNPILLRGLELLDNLTAVKIQGKEVRDC